MASVLKLKTDIKKLKAAIASKATSGAIKTKLRGKLTTLENELDKLQPNKRKPKTTGPKSESALVKLAKKRRTNQGLSTSKSDIERDAIRPAKKAGKRISANGNRYYEYRDNRVDNRQPPKKYRKLADGGMMADKGTYVTSGFTTNDEFGKLIEDKFKMQDWYEDFNDSFEKLLTKKYITQAEYEKYQEILDRVDPIDKYGKMSGRAAAKKFVDDNKRYTKMADGGKTKEQEVVRGYFEDEAYEYGKGGEVMYLSSNGTSQTLVTDKSNATPMWIMDAEYYISSNPKNNAMMVAEKIDETLPDRVGKNYIVKITKKNKMADGGEVEKEAKYLVTLTDEDGFEDDVIVMAVNEDDAVYQAEQIRGYESTGSGVVMLTDFDGNKIKYKKGGYMADGGMVAKLEKDFASKDLDDDLMMDGYHVEIFDYTEEAEKDRFIKKNSKDNYLVPWDNNDDNYYIVVVPKNKMADGGSVAKGNYEMLMSQAKEVMHHAEELMKVAKPDMDVEAWVVAKAERATTDLSDITHYLDGLKMAMGGMVKHNEHKVNA